MTVQRLKDSKDVSEFRKKLLQEQGGLDPVLGIPITMPVVDHQHFAPWNCRGVLQNEVNAFEGRIYNAFRRYCKHLTDRAFPDVLRSLADYLERDYSKNPIHHTALNDELRLYKRLNAEKQKAVVVSLGIEPSKNEKGRCLQVRKALREGKLTYKQLIEEE